MALLKDLFSGGVAAAGLFDQVQRNQDIGEQAITGSKAIGDAAIAGTQFQPFSVASGTGNVQASADGSLAATLGAGQQGIVDQATQGAQGMFSAAQVDPAARQQTVFDQIMAGMAPGQERDRLSLEGRLQQQGRGGIQSSMYGGAPEQFALAKAQQEANLGAWGQAQQLGMAEQAQQANIGDMFSQASLRPEAALFNQMNPAINVANLGQTGQIAGVDQSTQSNITGLEAQIQAERTAANLASSLYGTAAQAAGAFGGAIDDTEKGLFAGGGQVLKDIFF
jgi:hypothetical protein